MGVYYSVTPVLRYSLTSLPTPPPDTPIYLNTRSRVTRWVQWLNWCFNPRTPTAVFIPLWGFGIDFDALLLDQICRVKNL